MAIKRPCRKPGCKRLTADRSGFCEEHKKESKDLEQKKCTKCGEYKLKDNTHFGLRSNGKYFTSSCKECMRLAAKEYRKRNPEYKKMWYQDKREEQLYKNRCRYWKNKEKINKKQREWYYNNKEERKSKISDWRNKNIDKWLEIRRVYERKKRKEDVGKCISERISAGMRRYLRGGSKGKSWYEFVDFTLDELVEHIESHFLGGMSWENRDLWHIDHIRPLSSFDIRKAGDSEFKKCWSLENLRPLWAKDNISKSNRWTGGR